METNDPSAWINTILNELSTSQSPDASAAVENCGRACLKSSECACGMVTSGKVTHPFLCHCTVGYTRQIFETLFGRPVNVTLLKSILNGDGICLQKITIG